MLSSKNDVDLSVTGEPLTSITPPLLMNENEPSNDIFENHKALVDWILSNSGFLHPKVQLAFSDGKGYHAVAGGSVPDGLVAGTRIASCPMEVTMSVLNALGVAPFSNRGTKFPEAFLRLQSRTPESLQAFFLMEQSLRENSWWRPYINTLPTVEAINFMQFEAEADVQWLEGTNLKGGYASQTTKWKDFYLQGSGQLRNLGWTNAKNGSYTW
jgi:hypothetical protein